MNIIGNSKSNNNSNNNGETWTKPHSNDKSNNNSNNNRLIWYIDANNLYGYAMMQKLPYKGFEYSSTSLYTLLNTPDDSDHGYYIVCDINYTNNFKDRTEQLALMPNKTKINVNEIGHIKKGSRARTEKLLLDQNNKTEYMVHYRMFKFYVNMGVKVTIFKTILMKEQRLKLKRKRI